MLKILLRSVGCVGGVDSVGDGDSSSEPGPALGVFHVPTQATSWVSDLSIRLPRTTGEGGFAPGGAHATGEIE